MRVKKRRSLMKNSIVPKLKFHLTLIALVVCICYAIPIIFDLSAYNIFRMSDANNILATIVIYVFCMAILSSIPKKIDE